MSSLVSANGPSVICWLLPATRMRLPWLLGYRPPASRRTPAFTISSLNRIISMMTFSSGCTPASESLVALISTRNFIVGLLLFYEGDERAPLGSTRSAKNLADFATTWNPGLTPRELTADRARDLVKILSSAQVSGAEV